MIIESKDLEALRETTSKALIALLWIHLPIAVAIGMVRGTDWLLPAVFMAVLATAATLSWRMAGNGLSTRLTFAVALMGGVSMFAFSSPAPPGRSTCTCTFSRRWRYWLPIATIGRS